MNNFDICITPILKNEGGISNHPLDAGKLTKYGISQRSYPKLDIAALTAEQAKSLYKRDFWDANQLDQFPLIVAFEFFDCAVNCGAGTAARLLQRAVGVAEDGIVGPITLAAIGKLNADKLAKRMLAHRMQFYTKLSNWPSFGAGWVNRLANNVLWESNHV
ncbi:glycoside hydrolase family 108 protein [Undibacterium pigrum]|uniref:Putative peptidoglycan binding protein n=1 Tax=Undibacterium pigrum TaxID=401470 RepID=A0A318J2Q3_9BURK|nr:glycosyl hydrolase 108 family protein [Undibacterium pigrum]PXX41664.1 putative peptidoglycan binding protein [Undibacterium pigrum]